MIKHIVMWKLKDSANGKTKAENAAIIKEMLEALNDRIPLIQYAQVGINMNDSEAAYDAVLVSEFLSTEDLNAYQIHPEHIKVSDFVKTVRTDRVVVDYELA